jgi:hypothetical protein
LYNNYDNILIDVYLCRIITVQSSPDIESSAVTVTEEGLASLTVTPSPDTGVNLYILAGHEAMQL